MDHITVVEASTGAVWEGVSVLFDSLSEQRPRERDQVCRLTVETTVTVVVVCFDDQLVHSNCEKRSRNAPIVQMLASEP